MLKWKEYALIESTNYTHLKDNHYHDSRETQSLSHDSFSQYNGYAGLPRQEMYWERQEDCNDLQQ